MHHSPKRPDGPRHARLFELLRQENVARATRRRIIRPHVASDDVHKIFRHRAETSFTGGIPAL